MSTGPIDQNKPQIVRERIESSKCPDESASKTVGKHSGRTVLSGEQRGKLELGQPRDKMDCRQLANNKDFSNTVINSQNQKYLQRQDSGFNEKMSDAELSELDEIRLLDQVDYSDADSAYDSDLEESGRSERGDDDSEEGDNDHDESTMLAGFNRKNALRFAVVLSPGEIELLKKNVTQQDIEFFIAKSDGLKGDFFHTGDYLVEHVDETCRKIQQSFVRHSDVSLNAGQLVFWWNLSCKNIQDHLRWCKDVELKRLDATFIKRARKLKTLQSKKYGMHLKFMDSNNISVFHHTN